MAQHAGAKHVRIELETEDGHIHLRTRDDGRGFEPDSVKDKRGSGLISMDERARAVGAVFHHLPNAGAEVVWWSR